MRYIGNKTKLLDFIADVLVRRGICHPDGTGKGVAVDPFCGTASVAADLKRRGFDVIASDIMEYAYVFARAYVQTARMPSFTRLCQHLGLADDSPASLFDWAARVPPRAGFVHDFYSPDGPDGRRHGRMYFTPENAARIDTLRSRLEGWRADGLIDDDAFHVILAALIEAADRVANTTGVYAAFVKSWQPNAKRPLELRVPVVTRGEGSRALRADAFDVVAGLASIDLLYLDPPYNNRQYAGYYHVPELIAQGWFDGDVATRGKTGLIADADKRSDWSRQKRCEAVFEQLVAAAPWKHLVLSYNAEGIIAEDVIERVLRANGRRATFEKHALTYKRYRSDADGHNRRYRGDTVTEFLYCVDR